MDYYYGSRKFSFDLLAEDWDDAEARLNAIKHSGYIEGKLVQELPASTPIWIVRVWCGIRNIFLANVPGQVSPLAFGMNSCASRRHDKSAEGMGIS